MYPKDGALHINKKPPVSPLRKRYILRLIGRCIVLLTSFVLFFAKPDAFDILNGLNFFGDFSIFHVLWGIWLLVWLVWELYIVIFPERFWEFSNDALKCANCTDKLCTQYCQKLRKKGK